MQSSQQGLIGKCSGFWQMAHLFSSLFVVLLHSPVLFSFGHACALASLPLLFQLLSNSTGPFLFLCRHTINKMLCVGAKGDAACTCFIAGKELLTFSAFLAAVQCMHIMTNLTCPPLTFGTKLAQGCSHVSLSQSISTCQEQNAVH